MGNDNLEPPAQFSDVLREPLCTSPCKCGSWNPIKWENLLCGSVKWYLNQGDAGDRGTSLFLPLGLAVRLPQTTGSLSTPGTAVAAPEFSIKAGWGEPGPEWT